MLKVLLKKQLTEIFRGYFYDQRKNKARPTASTVALFVLFGVLIVGMVGGMFFSTSMALCEPLTEAGLDWLYFAILGLMAVMIGTLLCAFSTYTGLYLAKDNDMLLSMPIPVRTILVARLLTVYLMGLLYSAIVAVPASIVYRSRFPLRPGGVLASAAWVVLLSLCVLVLSCALGWCVAKLSRKIKNKSFVTVALSLSFMAAYYFVYYHAQIWIGTLVTNAASYGDAIRRHAAVLVGFGLAGQGNVLAMLCLFAVCAVATALLVRLLSRSFMQLVSPVAASKKGYRAHTVRQRNVSRALLGREFARFGANPTYILNSGIGVLFLLVGGVMLLLQAEKLLSIVAQTPEITHDLLAVGLAAAVCLLTTGNDMVAPSVSLEGKTIWQLQSLPVSPWHVLRAKVWMQLLLTWFPALFCCACTLRILPLHEALPLTLLVIAFSGFEAAVGLYFGLTKANLVWTNPVIPIKQSAPVAVAVFGGWGYAALIGGVYFLLSAYIGAAAYLYAAAAVTAALCVPVYRWLRTKGGDVFASL